jgi:hypothetical protein
MMRLLVGLVVLDGDGHEVRDGCRAREVCIHVHGWRDATVVKENLLFLCESELQHTQNSKEEANACLQAVRASTGQ